ncbi:nicotinamide-nucleotide amidohydrolase family protein [Bombilactobacillus apium]|nr:nicotinamide-nucleotide amidohydrolase family protein [Bombilactobacillus apium]
MNSWEKQFRNDLGENRFIGDQYQKLSVAVVQELKAREQTLTAAESLTAGLLQATLADVAGASQVFGGGFVTYSLAVKAQLLKINYEQLEQHGVVSTWTARQMAQQSSQILASDWGLGLTGVAGPGLLEGQPAGTVFIALAGPQPTQVQQFQFSGDRQQIRRKSVVAAFIMLINSL